MCRGPPGSRRRRADPVVARPAPGGGNGVTVKKALTWLAVAFVIFYVIKAPESSADIVRSAGQALGSAASSLAAFVGSLA
jgi:hypothetical protein